MLIVRLNRQQVDLAVDVLFDAFHEYPVIPYILGDVGCAYTERLRALLSYFVMARIYREEPILAIRQDDIAVAAAIVTLPGEREIPEEMKVHRESLWHMLGTEAKKRYERLGQVDDSGATDAPHLHLNMIGVRHGHMGRGLARLLLEEVHKMSSEDEHSTGVSLTTELQANIPLYQHFGYRIVGQTQISANLDSWLFFRPNSEDE